jgi:hypothetical protein
VYYTQKKTQKRLSFSRFLAAYSCSSSAIHQRRARLLFPRQTSPISAMSALISSRAAVVIQMAVMHAMLSTYLLRKKFVMNTMSQFFPVNLIYPVFICPCSTPIAMTFFCCKCLLLRILRQRQMNKMESNNGFLKGPRLQSNLTKAKRYAVLQS